LEDAGLDWKSAERQAFHEVRAAMLRGESPHPTEADAEAAVIQPEPATQGRLAIAG
jgi:hypothetical protein